jgi:serine/threonine protein kinase
MQSIDVNGKITFKLTDLGVARQINPGERTSNSIRGTEQYVHPDVYWLIILSLFIFIVIIFCLSVLFFPIQKKSSTERLLKHVHNFPSKWKCGHSV